METPGIIQSIQYAIAPAVMVSSAALLLLGFQNKFSSLANRFRALNYEKRTLSQRSSRDSVEEARLKSLTAQVDELMRRAVFVKNAILLAYLAIVCFVATSILIFVKIYTVFLISHFTIAIFLVGFLLLFMSSVLMIRETALFYTIISLEKKA